MTSASRNEGTSQNKPTGENPLAADQASWSCPVDSLDNSHRILLVHGEGGRASRNLIRDRILARLGNDTLNALGDAAILHADRQLLAFATDAYTVSPLFFPGGDIGKLAVYGTVNDLVVSGAVPRWLSLSLILEEGLPLRVFDQVIESIHAASQVARVSIVTGDTKVVPRGTADGIFVITSGIGEMVDNSPTGPASLRPGDELIVTGQIGRHGAAILCAREQFDFDPAPASDCASLVEPLLGLFQSKNSPRSIRDATRGGVSAVLHEWMEACGCSCVLEERDLPVGPEVRAVVELLGLDPLHLANEGTCVIGAGPAQVPQILDVLRQYPSATGARVIGRVVARRHPAVSIVRVSGREVPIHEPTGTPLPRIC